MREPPGPCLGPARLGPPSPRKNLAARWRVRRKIEEGELNRKAGQRLMTGTVALIIAGAALGMLGWMLWPR